MRMVIDGLVQRYVESDFTHIGAIESRGFFIGRNHCLRTE